MLNWRRFGKPDAAIYRFNNQHGVGCQLCGFHLARLRIPKKLIVRYQVLAGNNFLRYRRECVGKVRRAIHSLQQEKDGDVDGNQNVIDDGNRSAACVVVTDG